MPLETKVYDVAEYLLSREDMAEYLAAALEDGDPASVPHAIEGILRACGLAVLTAETGIDRRELLDALHGESAETVLKLARSLEKHLKKEATAA